MPQGDEVFCPKCIALQFCLLIWYQLSPPRPWKHFPPPVPSHYQVLSAQVLISLKVSLSWTVRCLRTEAVSGARIPKSWRASSSCSLATPMKEFSRKAGRPPTPSRKVYRGTRTRPKTFEGKEREDKHSSHYNKLVPEQISWQNQL